MQREKKLALNTVLFAISNFGSKALSFFLVPFYTAVFTTEQYGTIDLILTSNALLLPIVTLSISDAVLRFAMDNTRNKNDVFTTGIFVLIVGCFTGVVFVSAVCLYLDLNEYWIYVFVLLFLNCIYLICSQFCRAISKNLQFAIAGIIQTLVFILFNILFLLCFSFGIEGYLLSLIISYFLSTVFLFVSAKLYCFLNGSFQKDLFFDMTKYALPLIPNTVLWWVMNASDKYFISFLMGKSYNGLYAVANKFPSIINVISTVFFQAWQLSAIEEAEAGKESGYYNKMFRGLGSVIVLGVSMILVLLKPVFSVWTTDAYYSAWKYSSLLLFSAMFMCFSSFWGSNLIAMKNTTTILKSAFFGGLVNVVLNSFLIPAFGLYGAAFATFVGFFVTWFVRYMDGRKYFSISINKSFVLSLLVLFVQSFVLVLEHFLLVEAVLFVVILCINKNFVLSLCSSLKRLICNKLLSRGN